MLEGALWCFSLLSVSFSGQEGLNHDDDDRHIINLV